jgi:hypothetical protein
MAFNPILALGAAAAGGAYWYFFKRQPEVKLNDFVVSTGPVSKKKWAVRAVAIDESKPSRPATMEVWAPAGSWGPHTDLLVTTYVQDGNTRSRGFSGPDATDAMVRAAVDDFRLIDT